METGPVDDVAARRQELAANLIDVRARLAAACTAAGRSPDEVTLVAVTKTFPASDVLHLATLGVHDIGENRDQEAAPKAAQVSAAGVAVRWHFIGQLQRNKARSVVRYASLVHSVDSVRLADALAEAVARERSGPLQVLVQVSIDGVPGRGGAVVDGRCRHRARPCPGPGCPLGGSLAARSDGGRAAGLGAGAGIRVAGRHRLGGTSRTPRGDPAVGRYER